MGMTKDELEQLKAIFNEIPRRPPTSMNEACYMVGLYRAMLERLLGPTATIKDNDKGSYYPKYK